MLHFDRKRFNASNDFIGLYSQTQHVQTNKHYEYYKIKTFFIYLLDDEAFKKLSSLISISFILEKTSFPGIPPQ